MVSLNRRIAKIILTPDIAPAGCNAAVFVDYANALAKDPSVLANVSALSNRTPLDMRIHTMKCAIAAQRISGIDARDRFDDDPELREHARAYGAALDELLRVEDSKTVPRPFSAGLYLSVPSSELARTHGPSVCALCGWRPRLSFAGFAHVVYDHEQRAARFASVDEPASWEDGDENGWVDGGWWPLDEKCEALLPRGYVEWSMPHSAREPMGPLYTALDAQSAEPERR